MSERIAVDAIVMGKRHPNGMGGLDGLTQSVAEEGLLQPIGVTAEGVLVFGERRLRACRDILGFIEIDVRRVDPTSIASGEWHETEIRKDFTVPERVDIPHAVRAEIGHRQGHRTDLIADPPPGPNLDRFRAAFTLIDPFSYSLAAKHCPADMVGAESNAAPAQGDWP